MRVAQLVSTRNKGKGSNSSIRNEIMSTVNDCRFSKEVNIDDKIF